MQLKTLTQYKVIFFNENNDKIKEEDLDFQNKRNSIDISILEDTAYLIVVKKTSGLGLSLGNIETDERVLIGVENYVDKVISLDSSGNKIVYQFNFLDVQGE